jgi:hypothetical protein
MGRQYKNNGSVVVFMALQSVIDVVFHLKMAGRGRNML